MLPFQRIYFDANNLYQRDRPWWGNLELENLAAWAQKLGIGLIIPEPVERELEEDWLRGRKKVTSAIESFNKDCDAIDAGIGKLPLPDFQVLRRAYAEKSLSFRKKLGISVCPITQRLVGEVFERSVTRTPPFRTDKDRNFQDYVIFLSIVDDLRNAPEPKKAALLSGDGVFGAATFTDITAEIGVSLIPYKSMKEARQAMEAAIGRAVLSYIEEWSAEARRILVPRIDEIRQLILAKVSFVKDAPSATVLSFNDVKDIEVADIMLHPDFDCESSEFYFDVKLFLVAEVRPWPFLRPELAKVGETAMDEPAREVIARFIARDSVTVQLQRTVTVEASGKFRNGKLVDVSFLSAFEKRSLGELLASFPGSEDFADSPNSAKVGA